MTTIIINERSTGAKKLIEFLKTQSFVTIVEEKKSGQSLAKSMNEVKAGESPYNEEFVKKKSKIESEQGKGY